MGGGEGQGRLAVIMQPWSANPPSSFIMPVKERGLVRAHVFLSTVEMEQELEPGSHVNQGVINISATV